MIADLFCSAAHYDEEKYDNGVNIMFHRCENDQTIEIKIVDDGEQDIVKFYLRWEDFKRAHDIFTILGADKK